MTSIQRLLLEIGGGLLLVFVVILYERHAGAQACINRDLVANAHNQIQQAQTIAKAVTTVQAEAKTYEAATHDPVIAPVVVCVRKYSILSAASPAASTRRDSNAGSQLPSADSGSVQPTADASGDTDIAAAAITIGRDADAQIAELKHYIKNVCEVIPK